MPVLASQVFFRLKGARAREDTSVGANADLPARGKLVSFKETDETRRVNREIRHQAARYSVPVIRPGPLAY